MKIKFCGSGFFFLSFLFFVFFYWKLNKTLTHTHPIVTTCGSRVYSMLSLDWNVFFLRFFFCACVCVCMYVNQIEIETKIGQINSCIQHSICGTMRYEIKRTAVWILAVAILSIVCTTTIIMESTDMVMPLVSITIIIITWINAMDPINYHQNCSLFRLPNECDDIQQCRTKS